MNKYILAFVLLAAFLISTITLAQPTFTNAHFYDTDGNGSVEEVVIEMTGPIDDISIVLGDFDIGGSPPISILASGGVNSLDPGTVDDKFFTFQVSISGTAVTTVAYTQGTLTDGTLVASDPAISTVDAALPVLLTATAVSDVLVELQYSEDVTPTWNTAADWTATGLTSTGAAQNADNSIVNLSVTSLGNTGYTASDFALTINDDASDQVLDGGGNNAADVAGFNVDDGQLPVLLSMTLAGDNSNGFLTFSEGVYRNPGSNALRINNEIDFSMTSGGATPTGDGVANFVHVAGASTVTFDLDFTGTPDGTEVLTAQLDGIGELFDLAGNEGAFPQSVQANLNDTGPPAIVSGTMAPDNTYIDVEFNDGVYDSDGSSPLAADGSVVYFRFFIPAVNSNFFLFYIRT